MNPLHRTITSALGALPGHSWLAKMKEDSLKAKKRGYYDPDEDERLREVFAQYLSVRFVLLESLEKLLFELSWKRLMMGSLSDQKTFLRCLLMASTATRYGLDLVDLARVARVTWKKLDEAEPRFGIERKTFTKIYQRVTHPHQQWRLRIAWKFFRSQRFRFQGALESSEMLELLPLIEEEQEFFFRKKRLILWRRILYRLFSLHRRPYSSFRMVSFHLFRASGSLIADLKQPHVKAPGEGKRVTEEVKGELLSILEPGDVVITRHDDALSNLFLPGFWPHAALYLGSSVQREALGLEISEPEQTKEAGALFLESKKDGVKIRPLRETLEVDACLVLRPKAGEGALLQCLEKALTHAGKRYDFLFDFRQADRLACTAVIYRTYHGLEGAYFQLNHQSGRLALSAEDLIRQLRSEFGFELRGIFGVEGSKWVEGELACNQLNIN